MGPSPSCILLSNQRLMVLCPYLYTGNPHILTSIYRGTATITSQPNSVLSKPFPTGSPLCVAILSCSKKKKDHLRKALTKCRYPKWALDKVEKRLNRSSRQVVDGGTNNAQSAEHEVKNKGHIVIPYTQGLCESIKKICGRYGIQTHFKGGTTIKSYWSPQRTKTLWSTKVVSSTGTNVGT